MKLGSGRTRTGIDEHAFRGQGALGVLLRTYHDGLGRGETGFAEDEVEIRGLLEAPLAAAAEAVDDVAFALPDALHVHANIASVNAVVRPTPSKIGDPRARDHRLGRCAAFIDARSSDVYALNQGSAKPSPSQRASQRRATLARADDNRLVRIRSTHEPSTKPKY